jgi:hypothetical protein
MRFLRNNRSRFTVAAFAVAIGIYLSVHSSPGMPAIASAASTATATALDRKMPQINVANAPLTDVFSVFKNALTVTIRYDRDAFAAEGIDPDKLVVTARLRDLRARRALEFMLADASQKPRLRYFIANDGTIVVTTPRGDAKRAMTRVYNVSDFTVGEPQTPQQELQRNRDLTRLFSEAVDPESWEEVGGEVGSIRVEHGLMTVRQTPENLRRIATVLGELSETSQRLCVKLQEDAR